MSAVPGKPKKMHFQRGLGRPVTRASFKALLHAKPYRGDPRSRSDALEQDRDEWLAGAQGDRQSPQEQNLRDH